MTSPDCSDIRRSRRTVVDSENGCEVVQRVLGVFEVECQSQYNVQGGLGIAVAAGVEVSRPALDTSAVVGSGRRNTAGQQSTLDPGSHDLRVNSCSVVENKVR